MEHYSVTTLDEIAEQLRQQPTKPRTKFTKGKAIARLAPQIKAMQRRGYTLQDIAEVLTKVGIPISSQALSYHLNRAKTKVQSRKKSEESQSKDTNRNPDPNPELDLKSENEWINRSVR